MIRSTQTLDELDIHNDLHPMCVPAHSGVEGNERADCLLNRGTRGTMTGPEPFCGAPRRRINQLVTYWAQKKSDCH